jgi:hypothetical protein
VLPLRKLDRGEPIFPAQVVPVVYVKCDWDECFPKRRIRREFRKCSLGWRTTAAPFRGEEFDQRNAFFSALKPQLIRTCVVEHHANRGEHEDYSPHALIS